MIACLLFDLDGTLFDSHDANVLAYDRAFRVAGLDFDRTAYRQVFGLRYPEMMQRLAPNATQEQLAQVKQQKTEFYKRNLSLVRANDGLMALLESCRAGHKTGLITTASRTNVENLLDFFKIDRGLFDVILTGEDVQSGKPDPECYLTAMQRLGVQPADCVIFEDSDTGVQAAKAAGAQVVRVSW